MVSICDDRTQFWFDHSDIIHTPVQVINKQNILSWIWVFIIGWKYVWERI